MPMSLRQRKQRHMKVKMPFSLKDIIGMIEDEIRGNDGSSDIGHKKMDKTINTVAAMLDGLIMLPPWMEPFDEPAIKFMLHIIADDVYGRIKHELKKKARNDDRS